MQIRLEHITKQFKNTNAVNDLSVTIGEGELVCLLGPSGCGKSTTLSMVAGLEIPTAGEIYFGDKPMSGVEAEERDIGMVFQNYALYPHMTVLENIMFPLKMRRIAKSERIRRAQETAAMMQITDLLRRKPGQLSGGQQQRVAIARALVKEPQILLLDEPFSNLDARLRIELRDEIRSIQKRLGITTIFVTHDQEEAMSISDRILLMQAGTLQQYASPQEMYRSPVNRFVAGFLGNPPMNFLSCTYEGKTLAVTNASNWTFPADKLCLHPEAIHGNAILGIRPEDLMVTPGCGQFTAEITAIQTLGKEVYLKLTDGTHILTACMSWDHDFQVGERLELSARQLHLFPTEAAGGGGGTLEEN